MLTLCFDTNRHFLPTTRPEMIGRSYNYDFANFPQLDIIWQPIWRLVPVKSLKHNEITQLHVASLIETGWWSKAANPWLQHRINHNLSF